MAEDEPAEGMSPAGEPSGDDFEDTVDMRRTGPGTDDVGDGDGDGDDTTIVRPSRSGQERLGGRPGVIEAEDEGEDDTIVRRPQVAPEGPADLSTEQSAPAPADEPAEPPNPAEDPVDSDATVIIESESESESESDTASAQPADDTTRSAGASTDDPAVDPPVGEAEDTATDRVEDSTTNPMGDSDDTVLVTGPGTTADADTDADADTIVVAKDEDATAVRAPRDDDPTIVSGAAAARGDERTRPAAPVRTEGDIATNGVDGGSIPVKAVMVAPRKRKRRVLKPAPVPAGYGERAVLAPGAGAVSTYRVREISRPPASAQALATRSVSRVTAGIVSVSKRSRRLSLLTMAGFGLSLVVSVAGLVLIARAVFLGD